MSSNLLKALVQHGLRKYLIRKYRKLNNQDESTLWDNELNERACA